MVTIEEQNSSDDEDEKLTHTIPSPEAATTNSPSNSSDVPPHQNNNNHHRKNEGVTRMCDGCGLPPRIQVDNDTVIPLQRCSLCQQAWYHDRSCQKRHFPQHKKVCKRLLKRRLVFEETQKHVQCVVEESSNGKGRCVFANRELKYGTVVGPKTNNITKDTASEDDDERKNRSNSKSNSNNHWQPLVPPVLLENHRRFRCAVCFGMIPEEIQSSAFHKSTAPRIYSELEELYPVRICSDACQRLSVGFATAECEAITKLKQQHGSVCPPMILPTAVLLYRLARAIEKDRTGNVRAILSQLQSEREYDDNSNTNEHINGRQEDEEERAHTQAVTATTWAMMKASNLPLWKLEDVEALLRQVKLNGFSICTAESVALGIGIYTSDPDIPATATNKPVAPNWINHDCRPNLLQSFDYGVVGQYPSLRLTVCATSIKRHEELSISYTDHAMPKTLRRSQLLQNYGFMCNCAACRDDEEDSIIVGLKCPQPHCSGLIQSDKCSHCNTIVSSEQARLDDLLSYVQSIDEGNVPALENACQKLKSMCTETSWYVRECQERLLQALLDTLGCTRDNVQQQYAVASRALEVVQSLVDKRYSPKHEGCFVLRRIILQYKSIKLRLFLNVDPNNAMHELQQAVLPTCQKFFPNHHEIMRQIFQDGCM